MIRNESTESYGTMVIRREDEDIESLIKRFKKKVNRSGILRELKIKSFYEKPSVKLKRKINEARSRRLKDQIKLEKIEKLKKSKKTGEKYHDYSNK